MKRFEILNRLIETFGYKTYLEIGVRRGECFRMVNIQQKESVDPKPQWKATHVMTSDDFFKSASGRKWDLMFIDGLHLEEQVDKDIENCLAHLSDNGTIVVHDCNPPTEANQRRRPVRGAHGWNGTVWRSLVKVRARQNGLSVFTVDTDWGCGVIRRGTRDLINLPDQFDYKMLEKNRARWLGLISVEEFKAWLNSKKS